MKIRTSQLLWSQCKTYPDTEANVLFLIHFYENKINYLLCDIIWVQITCVTPKCDFKKKTVVMPSRRWLCRADGGYAQTGNMRGTNNKRERERETVNNY